MEMIRYTDGRLLVLDQTLLPGCQEEREIGDIDSACEAIKSLRVRGAPLIGVSSAYFMALSAKLNRHEPDFLALVNRDRERLAATRPTAVNLFWALKRSMNHIEEAFRRAGGQHAADEALLFAEQLKAEDIAQNRRMGVHGVDIISDGDGVLTHCNAGALATAGYGTALGVLRAAKEAGKRFIVYADETRPLLQGARLTCYELQRDGFDVTLLADNMAGALMAEGRVQVVVVGADRIAANGDTANKIGTYSVAVLAKAHGIPFYVAAPVSTIDPSIASGKKIPIEHRDPAEVTHFGGACSAPDGISVYNPAFDVTPNDLIAGIITEKGLLRAPYRDAIEKIFR